MGGNLTKLWQKQICTVFLDTVLNLDIVIGWRFRAKLFYWLPKLHGIYKTQCLEIICRRVDHFDSVYIELKSKGFYEMISHRCASTQPYLYYNNNSKVSKIFSKGFHEMISHRCASTQSYLYYNNNINNSKVSNIFSKGFHEMISHRCASTHCYLYCNSINSKMPKILGNMGTVEGDFAVWNNVELM